MPSGYARPVGVIGRVTIPTRSLSANQIPRNKPKRKADRTFAAHCRGKWGKMCHGVSKATPFSQLLLFRSRPFFY